MLPEKIVMGTVTFSPARYRVTNYDPFIHKINDGE